MKDVQPVERLIWATRGRSWGFRFLLGGGEQDPLPTYERAFAGSDSGSSSVYQRSDGAVALRFVDPFGRRDASGRVIPHEFVVPEDLAATIDSVDGGRELVWPLVADAYAEVWDAERAPSTDELGLRS